MSDSELADNASPSTTTSLDNLDVLQKQTVDGNDVGVKNTKLDSESDVTKNINGDADMENNEIVPENADSSFKENEENEEQKGLDEDKALDETDDIKDDAVVGTINNENNVDASESSNKDEIGPEESDLNRQVVIEENQEEKEEDNDQVETNDVDENRITDDIATDDKDKNSETEDVENNAQSESGNDLDQSTTGPSDSKGENEDDLLKEREGEQIQDNTQEEDEEEMDEDKLLNDADNVNEDDASSKSILVEENDEVIASEPASDLCDDQDSSKHSGDSDAGNLADTDHVDQNKMADTDHDDQNNMADTDQVPENVGEQEPSQRETEEKVIDNQDIDEAEQTNNDDTAKTIENETDNDVEMTSPSENSEKVSCDVGQTDDITEITNDDVEMKESVDDGDTIKKEEDDSAKVTDDAEMKESADSGVTIKEEGDDSEKSTDDVEMKESADDSVTIKEEGDDSEKVTDDVEMKEEKTDKLQEDVENKEDQPTVSTGNEGEGEPVSSSDDKKSTSDAENESKKDEDMIASPGQTDSKEEAEKSIKVSDDEIDESDIKIIDIKGDDDDKKDDVEEIPDDQEVLEDDNILKNNEDSGEMCLQIASVSGATDIPDVLKQDEENQKTLETETADKPIEVDKAKPEVVAENEVKQEVKQEVKAESKPPSSTTKTQKVQTCIVCDKTGKCKYNIVRNGDIKHLCDDACFKMFRTCPTAYLRSPDSAPSAPAAPEIKKPPVQPIAARHDQYKTCSVCQLMNIKTSKPFLNWQGMDFCGEDCLGKFQGNLNASCSNCGSMVKAVAKGKYCLRFANEVKQFCSGPCYSEFKKRQKLCECCQKDISKSQDAFVAPVGREGTFKDFCSQSCLQKYEDKTNNDVEIIGVEKALKSKVLPKGNFSCAVCSKNTTVKHEIKLEGKMNRLCSDPCFSAFQYANKLSMNTCDNCGVYCYNEGMTPQYIQFEGQQKRFCSYICVNQFKSVNKKIVNCAWCSCKKSNFDMIERVDANNKYQLFCSLNCLSLYRVNLQATSNQAVMCDECKKFVPAQYHLTMSDASVRNFCSYQCVMSFQSQFSGGKQTPQQNQNVVQPQSQRAVGTRASARAPAKQGTTQGGMPVISNVVSLAQQGNQQINLKNNSNVPVVVGTPSQNTKSSATQHTTQHTSQQQPVVKQQIIIQPPPPKVLKNKSLLCKPFVQTKATSCRPHTQTKETQTECDWEPKKYFIPVPVPVYVPTPMAMYTQPTPVPLPIPVPIPVPCFIPTTKKSAEGILKQIKEIQEKIPNDPLEAELLMMAEAVAGGEEDSDSDTELDAEPVIPEPVKKPTTRSSVPPVSPPPLMTQSAGTDPPPAPQNGNEFGEDMLQMALRMASEMTEPVMDLESSIDPVPVNTEPPLPKPEDDDEEEEVYKVRETRSRRGATKRARGGGNNRRSKRQKTSQSQVDTSMDDSMASEQSAEQEPAPDANMYLKFTYGINAWKHWVVHKNAQLEKVSKHGSGKLKLFKTDMLGCSADELNYSLCLFVKEVRKPNGEEYAPDSIFYLCLGIQQYLFENGRIDNIFTDMYYEKYTECLNEVLQRYEPKLNTAGQLVCRIEEEHLWESKQLGAHSPHVLLNTLVYFNTKYFMLKTAEDHMKLSFTHIMKHWKKIPPGRGNSSGRSVYLRYYCPLPTKPPPSDPNLKKKKEELPVYEQGENIDNPLRCPVKLYEFYLSKCPESIKNRNDAFYLVPERSCVPDSPVWYSTQNLSIEAMNKMLNRLRLVREIQEALLHTQPVYVS